MRSLAYPWVFRSNYAINVGFLVLFAAYLGQTWNIAGGFAGQTSFGHVVFFGVGAYVSTILQSDVWRECLDCLAVLGACRRVHRMADRVLSYRAGLKGSYFALITLAVAEVGRIVANSVPITKGGLGILMRPTRVRRTSSSGIRSGSTTSRWLSGCSPCSSPGA